MTEKTTISNPNYLFSFENVQTKLVKNFISTDTTCAIERYNLFVITESSTEIPLSGQIELEDEGQWDYTIYAQASPTNLDPTLATEVVETGYVRVVDTTANTDVEYTLTETDTQYDPE